MTIGEARTLIASAPIPQGASQHWLDLGCGTGTFTRALAELLPPGSTITAVDNDPVALRSMPSEHGGIGIVTQLADVAHMELGTMDGVLMANVLHFIADQPALVHRLAQSTQRVLLVEYDRTAPLPPYVPYPLPRTKARLLFERNGFPVSLELGTRPSRYGPDPLYAIAFGR